MASNIFSSEKWNASWGIKRLRWGIKKTLITFINIKKGVIIAKLKKEWADKTVVFLYLKNIVI